MADLNVHPSLTYLDPPLLESGNINYASFKPVSNGTFNPGDTCLIKLSSTTDFYVPERSYMKFTFTPSAAGNLNPMGASAVINSVQEQWSGYTMPQFQNYNAKNQIRLNTASAERRAVQTQCEMWGTTQTAVTAQDYQIVMPVPSGVEIIDGTYIPLLALNGLEYNFTFEAVVSRVLDAGTYSIKNVEIVAALVTPPADYINELSDGLRNGVALKIGASLYRSYNFQLTSATNQDILLNTDFYDSLNSITAITHDTASGFFNNSSIVNDFFITIDSKVYPRNKHIIGSQEAIYQQLCSTNSVYSTMNLSPQTFQHYSWKTGLFNTGIQTSNGSITINTAYGSTPTGATTTFILSFDALILISENGVTLLTAGLA
ncbi:hypothetical protein HDV06_001357 [Boothiomyces sp. JEL0866]|nr:hypothetical protein HDV06_001357 [Boothiomyces sp. JEL0866]